MISVNFSLLMHVYMYVVQQEKKRDKAKSTVTAERKRRQGRPLCGWQVAGS